MPRRILDTSVLIRHWHSCGGGAPSDKTVAEASKWGKDLFEIQRSRAILTPVYIEFVAGTTSQHEQKLARSFLEQFDIVDKGDILKQDWSEARRLAERIPSSRKRRQLGDCLIRAIANRLRYEVLSFESSFPK